MSQTYDVAIIGAGFSGSILAGILALRCRRVALIDAATHPRFTIGESSTPIADLMLRRLGEQHGLSDLVNLSAYGTWQQGFPELACGKKRGFSYFDHRGGAKEDFIGQRSLMVAASPTDDRSDTHWYRRDLDQYLFQQALASGVDGYQSTRVSSLKISNTGKATIRTDCGQRFECDCLIDASGSAAISARLLNRPSLLDQLSTHTACAFAHFSNVQSFSAEFDSLHHDQRAVAPFDADDAAQHHLIQEGWAWMLRMNNSITSVGVTSPTINDPCCSPDRLAKVLATRFEDYPELQRVMKKSSVVDPPAGIVRTARLQRFFDPVVAPCCVMMPTTAVTIDPLHSTGIAHSLIGVYRIAEWILGGYSGAVLRQYQQSVMAEAVHLDRMVWMAYQSMRSFKRFTAACMVYFAAAISCEERLLTGDLPTAFWSADDDTFAQASIDCARILYEELDDDVAVRRVQEIIAPWNSAGLFESVDNRYAYTATK